VAATQPAPARRDASELVATVLLALAALATAWCSFQANRWGGEQAKAASATNGLRIQAARADGLARTQSQLDVATFIAWVDGYVGGDPELADFYAQRFRAEFKPVFEAWMATDPFNDPAAPSSPFAMDEYHLQATADAERLDEEAAASAELVRLNIQRSSNYVLGVVLFAAAMFFAGMGTKLKTPLFRWILLGVGSALFLGALAWVATFPVSFAIV
jgi:hypothetical protein